MSLDRGHHIIYRADTHKPVHSVVGYKFVAADRVKDIAGYNPLAVDLLHGASSAGPLATTEPHDPIVAAAILREDIGLACVKSFGSLETGHDFIESFLPDVFAGIVILWLAEELNEVAIVHTPLVVTWSVLETECDLLTFVLFPVATGVEPSISERI